MYTILISVGLSVAITVIPALFGVDAWKSLLPGMLIGVVVFVEVVLG